jgi:hypothetical protein
MAPKGERFARSTARFLTYLPHGRIVDWPTRFLARRTQRGRPGFPEVPSEPRGLERLARGGFVRRAAPAGIGALPEPAGCRVGSSDRDSLATEPVPGGELMPPCER